MKKLSLLFFFPMLLLPISVSELVLMTTTHFKITSTDNLTEKEVSKKDIEELANYIEKIYNFLINNFGPYLSKCKKINIIISKNLVERLVVDRYYGCQMEISTKIFNESFKGIKRYYFYITPLRGLIKIMLNEISWGWPSIHREKELFPKAFYLEWWGDNYYSTSPFEDMVIYYSLKDLNYTKIANTFYNYSVKTPFHYVFKTILEKYGTRPFKDLFHYITKFKVKLSNLDFYEATFTIIYFLMASTKKDLRDLFLKSAIPVPSNQKIAEEDKTFGLNVRSVIDKSPREGTVIWLYKGYWKPLKIIIYSDKGEEVMRNLTNIGNLPVGEGFILSGYYSPNYYGQINKLEIVHKQTNYTDPAFIFSWKLGDGFSYVFTLLRNHHYIYNKENDTFTDIATNPLTIEEGFAVITKVKEEDIVRVPFIENVLTTFNNFLNNFIQSVSIIIFSILKAFLG